MHGIFAVLNSTPIIIILCIVVAILVLEEMAEFEKLFQRKSQTVKKTEKSSHLARQHNSSRPIRLLDGQRSQAIAIVMKSLHVDLEEITQAVVAMETSLVDIESLKALNEMVGD